MTMPTLTAVTRTQGANRALKDGSVKPRTVELEFVEVDPLIAAFRRMVRGLEFDVTEMAITTYMCAKAYGKAFTALPIFLVRDFHHGAIRVDRRSGISHPKELAGKRVGVGRGWTVTTGVWARGILAHEYGLDLDTVTWVLSCDEHVVEYRAPANVVPIEAGQNLGELLLSGDLAAVINFEVDDPNVVPLIPDADEAALAMMNRTGVYPINHLVVVKDSRLAERPDLAGDLFTAFATAKRSYVEQLRAGSIEAPNANDRRNAQIMSRTGEDPLPYGIAANQATLDALVGYATEQGILAGELNLAELFAPGTLDLEG
jgi:ABC-type nitrate/sulfonate/bicarbonate transport system substrate-binding protein